MLPLLAIMDMEEERKEEEEERKEKQENLGNLLMGRTVKNFTDLEAEMDKHTLELFKVCKWSITPLMAACLLGLKDIVKYLLEKGADPNEKCMEEMNTPLHFACLQRDYIETSYFEWSFEHQKDSSTRKDIIELLFDHGALVERNSLGFLPIHCAALFAMEKIVDYFIAEETVADADRLMAMEVLGVSQCFLLTQMSQGYLSLLTAMHLRLEKSGPCQPPHSVHTELELLIECSECTTFDELHKLKYDEVGLTMQGLLVGDRVLPEKLKQKCLWSNMFCTCVNVVEEKTFFSLCQYGLKLESSSRLVIGTVLDGVTDFLWDYMTGSSSFVDPNQQDGVLRQLISYLETYTDIVMNAKPEHLTISFSHKLGIILATVIGRFNITREVLDVILKATEVILKISSEHLSYESSSSAAITLFEQLFDDIYDPECLSRQQMKNVLMQMIHALPFLLKYEHPRHVTLSTADTLLHLTMRLLYDDKDFDLFYALTRQLVRYGCPIEAKTWEAETARDLILGFQAYSKIQIAQHPKLEEMLALVTTTSEVLSLQELSARCVLRSKIPYSLGTVPSTVCDFLNGEDYW